MQAQRDFIGFFQTGWAAGALKALEALGYSFNVRDGRVGVAGKPKTLPPAAEDVPHLRRLRRHAGAAVALLTLREIEPLLHALGARVHACAVGERVVLSIERGGVRELAGALAGLLEGQQPARFELVGWRTFKTRYLPAERVIRASKITTPGDQ